MTDKKFTDKETIKALKCMLGMINNDIEYSINCRGCAFEDNALCSEICSDGIAKAALDLINRQKAEIERLKKEVSVARDAYMSIQGRYEYTKTEVCKEFAEKLKEKSWEIDWCCDYVRVVDVDDIDNLLKEMTGKE